MVTKHGIAEHHRHFGLHAREDVLVDGHRERRVTMAQALAYHLHRNARPSQDRGVRVPEVVQADARQRRLREVAIEDLVEQVGMRRPTFQRGEHDASDNGVIEPRRFYASPFTDISPQGPDELFKSADVDRLLEVVADVRRRAEAA
jgi:hypothetical protein